MHQILLKMRILTRVAARAPAIIMDTSLAATNIPAADMSVKTPPAVETTTIEASTSNLEVPMTKTAMKRQAKKLAALAAKPAFVHCPTLNL